MIKNDVFLWLVLAITGLNFLNNRLGPFAKLLRLMFFFCCAVSFFNYGIYIVCSIKRNLYKDSITSFSILLNFAAIWFTAYSQRKAISNLIFKVYMQRKYIIQRKLNFWILFFLVTFANVSPLLTCTTSNIISNFKKFRTICLTSEYRVQYEVWQIIIILFLELSGVVSTVIFPFKSLYLPFIL